MIKFSEKDTPFVWNPRITEVYGKIYAGFSEQECQSIVRFHA